MRIAVSSTGPGLDAEIDPRFGRCQYFVMVDGETMEFDAVENPNVMASGGAGIQSAQLVADKGAEVVLTGNCGPNAFQTLEAAGIPVCVGVSGTVRQVVEQYKTGALTPVSGPSVGDKFGVSGGGPAPQGGGQSAPGGTGGGPAGGMGRGMGMGGGGRWTNAGPGMQPNPSSQAGFPPKQNLSPEQELQMLKDQAEAMKQQLDQITNRIKDLDEK